MNELYHHGVKGMKWRVRLYRNKDGSLTASGKKRHYKIGVLQLVYSGLIGTADKMSSDEIIKKH